MTSLPNLDQDACVLDKNFRVNLGTLSNRSDANKLYATSCTPVYTSDLSVKVHVCYVNAFGAEQLHLLRLYFIKNSLCMRLRGEHNQP